MSRGRRRAAALIGGSMLLAGTAARAQVFGNPLLQSEIPSDYDRGRNTSVLDRLRPEYEAMGLPLGPLTVLPRVRTAAGFTSNVNGTDAAKRADAFFVLAPEVTAETDTLIDNITAGAGVDLQHYVRTPARDQTGYFANVAARDQIGRDTAVYASGGVRRYYEQNISTGIPADTAEPVPIDFVQGNVRVEQTVHRWQFTLMGEGRQLNFGDVRTIGGGVVDQDYRDRAEWLLAGRTSYAPTPETSVFVEVADTRVDYARDLPREVANRDGDSFRLLSGVNLDLGALVRGRVGVGYVRRSYTAAYPTVDGVIADVRLQLFPSEITTVTLSGRRYAGESTLFTSPGYFGTGVRAEVDHELNRNLLLNTSIDVERDRYWASNRRDRVLIGGAGARYFVSRSIGLGLQGTYLRRRSHGDFALPDFDEGRILLSMVFQR